MPLLDYKTNPLLSLTLSFAAWKSFLLAIALGAAIASDYDTSTSLFYEHVYGNVAQVSALATRLTRWDGLYFVHAMREGKVYEQEWAFGWGLPWVVHGFGKAFGGLGFEMDGVWEPLVAIVISHASHLIAVLALYQLTIVLCGDRKLAFIASALHILSPAGLFLSAPYAESPFSCLSFIGNLLFAISVKSGPDSLKRNEAILGAGIVFGVATTFRSNGLFGGILFAMEAVKCLFDFLNSPNFSRLMRLAAPGLGGIFVAAGAILPQFLAWQRYCGGSSENELRPWCDQLLPSIYTFVQEEYWDVGFLKYWTPNQIPLFLLAGPMLTILIKSGIDVFQEPSQGLRLMTPGTNEQFRLLVRTLAATQTILGVLAITNYHVQIISRLSSGYPVWYWWVAACLMDKKKQGLGYTITMFITIYAGVQGGLFASFLPPA